MDMKMKIRKVMPFLFLSALLLLYSIFGLSAMAQTSSEKPMAARALAALVEDLKEVVAKATPDTNEAALVSERWSKRTDLAGKTKREVINLLFEDVRAVIKDSGAQYQIYSMFSFFKQIPDEPQGAQTQAPNKSIYTDLAADKCRTVDVNKGMPGNYSGRCKGVGGYDLEVYLDDERNSVGVVLPSKKTIGLDLWSYFGGFSALGEKAEWRMKGKNVVALIVRLNVSDRGEEKSPTSYLIVSKISPTNACVVDIVKPGKNQNAQARRLADNASNKPCKRID